MRLGSLALAALVVLTSAAGCGASPAPAPPPPAASTTASVTPAPGRLPETVSEVEAARASGARWDNATIRRHYLDLVGRIAPANETWKKDGLAAAERARRAFTLRHDARVTCRAMMGDRQEVEALEARDQQKYGHPDGPTFDELVERQRSKGATGDALYEAIVESAQRTDSAANELAQPGR